MHPAAELGCRAGVVSRAVLPKERGPRKLLRTAVENEVRQCIQLTLRDVSIGEVENGIAGMGYVSRKQRLRFVHRDLLAVRNIGAGMTVTDGEDAAAVPICLEPQSLAFPNEREARCGGHHFNSLSLS